MSTDPPISYLLAEIRELERRVAVERCRADTAETKLAVIEDQATAAGLRGIVQLVRGDLP